MDIKIVGLILLEIILGILVFKTRRQKVLSNLFLFFFTILFALFITELIYRNFFRKERLFTTVNSYYHLDSIMGYRFDTGRLKALEYKGKDTIYNTYYTVLSDTDAHGFNYPLRKGFKNDTAKQETVFFGCSFTFGEGLPDEETLPYQYGQLTGTSSINRGCNGLGVHQVYQLFKSKYANRDNSNRVFVYSFFSEHILRAEGVYVWNCAGPLFTISDDTLLNKGISYKVKPIKGARLAHYGSFMGTFTFIRDKVQQIALKKSIKELRENDLAPCYLMLKQMAEMISKTGGKFIILNWDNESTKTASPVLNRHIAENKMANEIGKAGAIVLTVSKALNFQKPEYSIPIDGHPSGLANKKLAQYLAENIK